MTSPAPYMPPPPEETIRSPYVQASEIDLVYRDVDGKELSALWGSIGTLIGSGLESVNLSIEQDGQFTMKVAVNPADFRWFEKGTPVADGVVLHYDNMPTFLVGDTIEKMGADYGFNSLEYIGFDDFKVDNFFGDRTVDMKVGIDPYAYFGFWEFPEPPKPVICYIGQPIPPDPIW